VIVLAPWPRLPDSRLLTAARAMPVRSMPECSKNRSSSAARIACFITSGTSSMRTTLRRSSPNSPISTPSAVQTRSGTLGR
jgi:hypothetical protein